MPYGYLKSFLGFIEKKLPHCRKIRVEPYVTSPTFSLDVIEIWYALYKISNLQ